MYTLYYAPGACSLAVHVVLEWIGAPYQAVNVDVHSPDPEFLRINPAGAVPAFDRGGKRYLTQNSAILRSLARAHPQVRLDVDGDREKTAELERWTAYLTGDLHPGFYPVFMPQRYTTSTDAGAIADVRAAGRLLVIKKLALVNQHLAGRQFFLGDQRTLVDAYALPMVRWAGSMLPGGLSEFPEVRRHHEALLVDPAVRRAMIDEGLIDP
jgi:glutathione S-transferase